jgi:hypothetical protein
VIPAGVRRLGEADGFPSLGIVDIVLYRAPGHQRRPTATLAEHIQLWLKGQKAAPRLECTAAVCGRAGPPPAVAANHRRLSRRRNALLKMSPAALRVSFPDRRVLARGQPSRMRHDATASPVGAAG